MTSPIDIEVVDPLEIVADAASVLQEAWLPPSLHYSSEYLAWQFSFPSPFARLGVVARGGDSIVGFAGVTPRHIVVGSWAGCAAVVSFVAVRPAWRGRRIAEQLYDALLERLGELRIPVVTFGEQRSVGERVLIAAYERAGFLRHALGTCQPFACVPARHSPDGGARVADPAELSEGVAWSDAGVRLASGSEQIQHFARDPRWRRTLVATDQHQSAGGMVVAAPMWTARGLESVLTVDVTFAPSDRPALLRGIADVAASVYADAPAPMVVFPNAIIRDDAMVRAAGLRKLPARYMAHLCVPPELRFLTDARPVGTNVDLV